MQWEELKKKVYFEDGALRDIIIRNVAWADWKLWIDFINGNYEVEFSIPEADVTQVFIDHIEVERYFADESELIRKAKIRIGKCIAMCYFCSEDAIEYDIDPKEVVSMDGHLAIASHLSQVSALFDRPLVLSLEGYPHEPLLRVDRDKIEIVSL
ncbi:MAG: hypothetical protein EOP56_07295 [Sphingobacteriales bacterium]|nr:MAG: hypothetical protein EOP56_07295 [Sphingobacteriales bacterium]